MAGPVLGGALALPCEHAGVPLCAPGQLLRRRCARTCVDWDAAALSVVPEGARGRKVAAPAARPQPGPDAALRRAPRPFLLPCLATALLSAAATASSVALLRETRRAQPAPRRGFDRTDSAHACERPDGAPCARFAVPVCAASSRPAQASAGAARASHRPAPGAELHGLGGGRAGVELAAVEAKLLPRREPGEAGGGSGIPAQRGGPPPYRDSRPGAAGARTAAGARPPASAFAAAGDQAAGAPARRQRAPLRPLAHEDSAACLHGAPAGPAGAPAGAAELEAEPPGAGKPGRAPPGAADGEGDALLAVGVSASRGERPWYAQRQVLLTLGGYALLAMLFNLIDEARPARRARALLAALARPGRGRDARASGAQLAPLFASTPRALGGLGLAPAELAVPLAVSGVALAVSSLGCGATTAALSSRGGPRGPRGPRASRRAQQTRHSRGHGYKSVGARNTAQMQACSSSFRKFRNFHAAPAAIKNERKCTS